MNLHTIDNWKCYVYTVRYKLWKTYSSSINNVKIFTVEYEKIAITSVYKPPNSQFDLTFQHNPMLLNVVIGDFYSHSTSWGYSETNNDGTCVEQWAENNSLILIHDGNLPFSFNSGRWRRGYNPYLIFVSNRIEGQCKKRVLEPIPKTQHRPIILSIRAAFISQSVPFKRRFNFQKANWAFFTRDLDIAVRRITPTIQNYDYFIDTVKRVSRQHTPKGCRIEYISGLSQNHKKIFQDYVKSYEIDPISDVSFNTGQILCERIKEMRRNNWNKTISSIDMRHSSRKAWHTLKNIR